MSRPGVLPGAEREYSQPGEQTFRNAVEQELQDHNSRIERMAQKRDYTESLALRRFSFMFMGSSGNV